MSRHRGANRAELLDAVRWFLERAPSVPGVEQVALFGSLCTEEPAPKDVDLLVTVQPGAPLAPLAALGRRTTGRRKNGTWGVDLFVVEDGRCIGRACIYREPHPRASCGRNVCVPERPFLCDTSRSVTLRPEIVADPPLVLRPAPHAGSSVPGDVADTLLPLSTENPSKQSDEREPG